MFGVGVWKCVCVCGKEVKGRGGHTWRACGYACTAAYVLGCDVEVTADGEAHKTMGSLVKAEPAALGCLCAIGGESSTGCARCRSFSRLHRHRHGTCADILHEGFGKRVSWRRGVTTHLCPADVISITPEAAKLPPCGCQHTSRPTRRHSTPLTTLFLYSSDVLHRYLFDGYVKGGNEKRKGRIMCPTTPQPVSRKEVEVHNGTRAAVKLLEGLLLLCQEEIDGVVY